MQRVIAFLATGALLFSIAEAKPKPHFPLSYSAFSSPSDFSAFNSYYPNYFYDSYPLTSPTLKTYSTSVVHHTQTPTLYASYPSSFGYFGPSFYNFPYSPSIPVLPSGWDTSSFPSFGTPDFKTPTIPGSPQPGAPGAPQTPNFGTRSFVPKEPEPTTTKPLTTTTSSITTSSTTAAPTNDNGDGLEKLDTKVDPISNKIEKDSKSDKDEDKEESSFESL